VVLFLSGAGRAVNRKGVCSFDGNEKATERSRATGIETVRSGRQPTLGEGQSGLEKLKS
jgi:hypothetical protein